MTRVPTVCRSPFFLWTLHIQNRSSDLCCTAGALHVICAARRDLPQLQRLPGPGPLQRPSPPGLSSAVPLSAVLHYVHLPNCTKLDFAVTYLFICCGYLIDTAAGCSIHVLQSICLSQSSCSLHTVLSSILVLGVLCLSCVCLHQVASLLESFRKCAISMLAGV